MNITKQSTNTSR